MTSSVAIPEKRIAEFVERMKESEGSNLLSIVLYGSAASGAYNPEFSDINLLCIVQDTGFAALHRMSSIAQWWAESERAPLILGYDELARSTDVFSIEMIELKNSYRVLHGEDFIRDLAVPMHFHRSQVEYELREKVILLREQLLLSAGNDRQTWSVLMLSFSPLITLFRHALMAAGETRPATTQAALEAVAQRFSCDMSAFRDLLEVREHRKRQREVPLRDLTQRFVAAVEHVAAAVDRILESSRSS